MYALEHKAMKGKNTHWVRFDLCGNRSLLVRIRNGLYDRKAWRIIYVRSTFSAGGKYRKSA